jgi:hypothetical protein
VRIGVRRVALEPGRADVVGDLVVERPKILVGERPVLGDTVEVFTRKSDGIARTQCPENRMVLPPTPLNISGSTGLSVLSIG